ncbi:MAG: nicotinamide-nucleotide amidohydrolase family protein [Bacteroidia bacterium]|nr:nicotinamide-nucleotide amidohydrolase family protein [Bacteroidia bacterium]
MPTTRSFNRMPEAHLLLIGSELTQGRLADKNGVFLARELSALGFTVAEIVMVPDDRAALRAQFQRALASSAQAILSCGGLGHTSDDLTAEVWAEVLGDRLEVSPVVLEHLRAQLAGRGVAVLPFLERYALAPARGMALLNPVGLSPALYWDLEGRIVAALPGPPLELQAIWRAHVQPRLLARFPLRPPFQATLRTTGISESRLSSLIAEWEKALPSAFRLAYNPSWEGVSLHLRAPAEADATAFAQAVQSLRQLIQKYLYAEGDTTLAEALLSYLKERQMTLATAESCTGGHVAAALVDVPGASEVFLGSVVAYANSTKVALLGVSEATLAQEGAVSATVAQQMAEGVRKALGSTIGIATTGIAGPTGGTAEKPVGTVWFGIATPQRTWTKRFVFPGDRGAVLARATGAALSLTWQALHGLLE